MVERICGTGAFTVKCKTGGVLDDEDGDDEDDEVTF